MPTTALLDEKRLTGAVREWMCVCGSEIQRRRKDMNWSQEQLAELSGVHTATICRVELGLLMPKETVRLAIISALCCEVNDIWPPLTRHFVMSTTRVVAA